MTTVLSAPLPGLALAHRGLITENLWQRMVRRIAREEDVDIDTAERIVNEALGFLRCLADHPAAALPPSSLVDIGWHTFILYTREYAAFRERNAITSIHHDPTDDPGEQVNVVPSAASMDLTVQLGYPVDANHVGHRRGGAWWLRPRRLRGWWHKHRLGRMSATA